MSIVHAVRGRRKVLAAIQCVTIQTSSGRGRLLTAVQFLSILHTSVGRRRLFIIKHTFTAADIGAIKIIHHAMFEGTKIGEAAHPGPRLLSLGPRSQVSRLARRSRGGTTSDTQDSKVERSEHGLKMLHLTLRGYLPHIAETTAFLRGMAEKPFLVSLNETRLE